MLKPKNYSEEKAKTTPEMREIEQGMEVLYREWEWSAEKKDKWNARARKYNALALEAGVGSGFWKVIL